MSDLAPEATPVVQQAPSSQNPEPEKSLVEEVEAVVESVVVSVEEAAAKLVALVRDGRRAGDGEVDAAVADVEAAVAAKQ